MKKTTLIISVLFLVIVLIFAFSCKSTGQTQKKEKTVAVDKSKPGIIEAESYVKQEKGGVEKTSGRVDASKDIILSWNNAGHKLEWKFYIAADGDYKVVFRYCHNRSGAAYRQMLIDGQSPGKDFEKIKLVPTGGWSKDANDWSNFVIPSAGGSPAMVNLKAGEHTLTITNLGGDGQDGAANFDSIAFLPKDVDPATVLGKAAK
ncbi:MAG: carbohydrate-binding protein [Spirochaetes bacterium]|nr:carbohydrate-binding protein [Spirochaetota bacterium]